jgi:hypothetical protein
MNFCLHEDKFIIELSRNITNLQLVQFSQQGTAIALRRSYDEVWLQILYVIAVATPKTKPWGIKNRF